MRRYLLLILLLSCCFSARSITFSYISIENGLSQSTVFSIAQDTNGFMWFGTADGLNLYNGYQMSTYKHDYSDSMSLYDNNIRCLFFTKSSELWVGTMKGLQHYNSEKDYFVRFPAVQNVQVNCIAEVDSAHLLVGTERGLMLINKNNRNAIAAHVHIASGDISVRSIVKIDSYFLVGTKQGLYQVNLEKSQVELLFKELAEAQVMAICAKNNTKIWVATEGQGLYCINPKTKWIKNYKYLPRNEQCISSNYVRCLAFDGTGALWVGTIKGLSIYNEQQDNFKQLQANHLNDGSLSQNSVRSICLDNQGGMWLGTFYGGINYFNPLYYNFENIYFSPQSNSINDNVVNAIAEDANEYLWIGANDHGLNSYDKRTNKYVSYEQVNNTSNRELNTNHIKSLLLNDDGSIYIGAHGGGLTHFNPATRTSTLYSADGKPNSLTSNDVYSIKRDARGTLWVGTLNGLHRMNEQSKEFSLFEKDEWGNTLPSQRVFVVFEDSKRKVWVGTDKGVGVYYLDENRLESFTFQAKNPHTSISGTVNCIYEDALQRVWIGTTTGLFLYNESEKNFEVYTVKDGLYNDAVAGILGDDLGRLWISTNKGLSCFTPDTKTFVNYYASDGVRNYQFNPNACCKTKEGKLLFGGTNGITSFFSHKITSNPFKPAAAITQLKLFNQTVRVNDETGILSKQISQTKSITLKPTQSSFSLEFAVPNYLAGHRNTFSYKLEDYDKDWYVTNHNVASYANLGEGKYTFLLKVANNNGVWSDKVTQLEIVVLPHWYASTWAILIYAFLFCVGFFSFYRVYKTRMKMKHELEVERINSAKVEEMNQMKVRFFINMSHEFRTPLTLIISPLRDILNSGIKDGWLKKRLELIYSNAQRMLLLVQQLIDYRRAELGVFKLKATMQNLPLVITDIYKSFNELAMQKRIQYSLDIAPELNTKDCLFDAQYVERILFNLLSNAFKFTDKEGAVRIKAYLNDNHLCLAVADTGCGISKEELPKIFDRFFQTNLDNVGTGIGLSLVKSLVEAHHGSIEVSSDLGQGSEFVVCLPQEEAAYAVQDLSGHDDEPLLHRLEPSLLMEAQYSDDNDSMDEVEGKPTMLIVEDNKEMSDYLCDNFKAQFNMLKAHDGADALEKVAQHEVDFVITDVMMPVMDGIKFTKLLKQNIKTCHIPVIMLSAKSMVEDQLSGLSVGADDYISKPFSISVLESKVSNIMRSHRRMAEHYAQNIEIAPEKVAFNALDEEFLKKALTIVEQNIDNAEFTVDDFSSAMAMSRSNLHLKLKAITGESATDFIRRIRFQYACKLLKEGRYSVTEISYMSGFNSPSYFATSFKKYFNCLPTEFATRNKTK